MSVLDPAQTMLLDDLLRCFEDPQLAAAIQASSQLGCSDTGLEQLPKVTKRNSSNAPSVAIIVAAGMCPSPLGCIGHDIVCT